MTGVGAAGSTGISRESIKHFQLFVVMPGLGIHAFSCSGEPKTWMAGTSSAKTRFALLPGHDEIVRFSLAYSNKRAITAAPVAAGP
jgi:hypothetical protein